MTGDVNGDGTDDLILGARFADGPDEDRNFAGEAYVIFGVISHSAARLIWRATRPTSPSMRPRTVIA
ncbi:MAG: hypothetical protein CMJ64_24845 [Planctomycetaceae bacterium]|nr:hypothetical protein [Planctomycetaceae bacterium]